MFSIALTYDIFRPFAVLQRQIASICQGILALFRFGLGAVVGVTIFAIATGLFTSACSPACALAPYVYGLGIFVGSALCVPAATLSAPDRLAIQVLPWISAATILVPAGVFSHAAAQGDWQSYYMFYLVGTFSGGIVGTNVTLRVLASRMRVRVLT